MNIMEGIRRMLRMLGAVIAIALLLAAITWLASTLPLKANAAETTINHPKNEITAPNASPKKILKFKGNKKKQYKPRNKNPIKKPTTRYIS